MFRKLVHRWEHLRNSHSEYRKQRRRMDKEAKAKVVVNFALKQTRRPLPSLLSPSFFYDSNIVLCCISTRKKIQDRIAIKIKSRGELTTFAVPSYYICILYFCSLGSRAKRFSLSWMLGQWPAASARSY